MIKDNAQSPLEYLHLINNMKRKLHVSNSDTEMITRK